MINFCPNKTQAKNLPLSKCSGVLRALYRYSTEQIFKEFDMIFSNIFWDDLLPQRWFSNDEAQPFLVRTGSSPHRLDSVDRPCGDVSVTGSASRAARKAHCAALEVVIHAF